MKYVDFGKHGIKVSRFGLGCMRFPKIKLADGTEVIDEKEAIEIVRTAIDGGVNYIDTAYVYPGSEVVVGKALQDGYREKVLLVTKLPVGALEKEEDMQTHFDEELKRLQTDHIDVYHLHNMGEKNWENAKRLNALEFMKKLKAEGKIKYIAFSLHGSNEHWKTVVDSFDWDVCMMQYNYFDKHYQAGIDGLHYAYAKGLPVIIMESLRGGMLGKKPPKAVEQALACVPGNSPAEKAFQWLINQPETVTMLSGCNSVAHVKENLAIFEKYDRGCLTDAQVAAFDQAREAWSSMILCTACEYCLPCPVGVEIPTIFDLRNNLTDGDNSEQHAAYAKLVAAGKGADKCVQCGACIDKCPQKIAIFEKLVDCNEQLTAK